MKTLFDVVLFVIVLLATFAAIRLIPRLATSFLSASMVRILAIAINILGHTALALFVISSLGIRFATILQGHMIAQYGILLLGCTVVGLTMPLASNYARVRSGRKRAAWMAVRALAIAAGCAMAVLVKVA